MISVETLEEVAAARLADGRVLCREGRYVAALYLSGYAIEIKLKAQICKNLGWSGFPETAKEFENYRSFRTHNLDVLLSMTGMAALILAEYWVEWSEVEAWNPAQRYQLDANMSREKTHRALEAATTLVNVL